MKEKQVLLLQISVIILMIVALNPGNPYSYYVMLRFVSFGAFAYFAYYAAQKKMRIWMVIFAVLAIRFNPFLPIYSKRSVWEFYNLAAALATGLSIYAFRAKRRG